MTRDSKLLWLGFALAIVGYLLTTSPITQWGYYDYLNFASVVLAWLMGKLGTSPLPGAGDPAISDEHLSHLNQGAEL